jgi:O-antigen/teichoic acid export membrane protein
VPLVFGDAYRPSVDPFLWLLPSAVGFAASAVFSTALLASSAPSLSSLGPGVALVVGVALDLVLIPPYAATGAAAAASAALLAGGAAAAIAFGLRERHSPAELVPRRGDLQALASAARRMLGAPFGTRAAAAAQARSRRAARRTGASPS